MAEKFGITKARCHHLKCLPEFYRRILDGSKTFEVRLNDRFYQAGDHLVLYEYDASRAPGTCETGKACEVRVGFVLPGGKFGIDADHVVMSIEMVLREAGGAVNASEVSDE